ncbi:MAG: hypothetical protein K0B14_17900 [Anaerolineaceae bacterium]|nr:hypothetical protein [Anaerolineaceae bacterium]
MKSSDLPLVVDLVSEQLPQLTCIKLLRNLPGKRQVFSGTWEDQPVVAKIFSGKAAQRHWQREKNGSAALHRAQIPTPEMLYAGNLRDSRPILIYQELPKPITALEYWQNCQSDEQRLGILRQLIVLVASIHRQGLVQTDIHLNNFLNSNGTLHAIDGDGIRSYPPFFHALAFRKNLALLLAQLPMSAEALIHAVIPTYLEHHPQSDPRFNENLFNDLNHVRRKRRLRYVVKCTRNCSEFVRRQSFSHLAIFRRDCHSNSLDTFLQNPDDFMAQGILLKDGNSATVVKIATPEGTWVIKRYNIKGFVHALKRGLRTTRAMISWRNAHRLNSSGIETPQAIAVLEKRVGLWRRNCYYIAALSDGISAAALNKTTIQQPTAASANLANLFKQLFQLRIYHGDCKATNFLLNQDDPVIIDLDAMGESRWKWIFMLRYRKDRQRFLNNWPDESDLYRYFDQQLP